MDTRTSPIPARLATLREVMHTHGVDALLIPSADPHLSEYLPGRWQGRMWFSGFTGSMGTLVVTGERALLFADGRYWAQAETELYGTTIELVKIPSGASTQHLDWLAANVPQGKTVAVDANVIGLALCKMLRSALDSAKVKLKTDVDLLDFAWTNREALPSAAIVAHAAPHAATPRPDKLADVRAAMSQAGCTHHFVSTVDDIAWITNLRGADVTYNPVFVAHLLINAERATLFVAAEKIDSALASVLAQDGIDVADYTKAAAALRALPPSSRLLIDPKRITLAFREAVPATVEVIEQINPSTLMKSRKTAAEAAFIREAMIEDGAAMCRFYTWLEQAMARGERITEITIDEKLSGERAKGKDFVGLSFGVIAGFNGNGAMPHYRATSNSHAVIAGDGLLLIDSGGQYLGGTTDITRVWPIGRVSDAMKRDYTLVLKGTIALSRTRFPRGTLSPMLDAIARAPLWAESLEYGHGTGHGVGYFLNVHEGPQSISKAIPDATMAMQPGMITSIEPGLYRPNRWGVRIENLVLNVPAPEDEFGEFLAFETLTLCPIDTHCIDRNLMREDEIEWLNEYHRVVRDRLSPRVSGDALAWLMRRTEAL